MQKIVINACFGGFGLSHAAMMRYAELAGFELYAFMSGRDKNGRIDFTSLVPYEDTNKETCIHYYKDREHTKGNHFSESNIERNDPILVRVVEELGKAANGYCASLRVVEIPDGVEWEISEYDGSEHVAEKHRTWR